MHKLGILLPLMREDEGGGVSLPLNLLILPSQGTADGGI